MNHNKYNMLNFISRYVNDVEEVELYKALSGLPDIGEGVWLAGGAIRRTLIGKKLDSDFDFFFKSEDHFKRYSKALKELGGVETRKTDTNETYSITIGSKPYIVQLIKISYYSNPVAVIDSFDFTITQFAYDGESLYCGKHSLWDLSRRKLALHKLTYGVSTMRRLIKYTNQGFTACSGVMQSILQSVVDDPSVINSNVVSVD